MTAWFLPLAVGFGTGILSSWGVGGGTLLLLVMTLFLGVDPLTARTVNLLYFLPTAAAALFYHRKNRLLDKQALRCAVPAGLAAAAAASALACAVDVEVLRKPFGIFLLFTAALTLLQNKKQKK